MSTFHLSRTIKGFMLLMPTFFFLISFKDAFLTGNHADYQLILMQILAFLPFTCSHFYKITIDNEKFIYYSAFGKWEVELSQIQKVELVAGGKGSSYLILTTKQGRRKEFETTHFDFQKIWKALRPGLMPHSTHRDLTKTLLYGQPIEMDKPNGFPFLR